MAERTAIEWADRTWSPWEGCTKVSPACDHCYAERMNKWLHGGENWGPTAPRRVFGSAHWEKPHRWNAALAKRAATASVFPSMCDPFDNAVAPIVRGAFYAMTMDTPNLRWLLLTKRVGNVTSMVPPSWLHGAWPRNVAIGATVVTQAEADRDVPKLLAVPTPMRFLSIEPMLEPINLGLLDGHPNGCRAVGLDWVICGGESGPQARPAHPDWVRSLRDQCAAAGVAFLFKQWGEWVPMLGHAQGIPVRRTKATHPDGTIMGRAGVKAAGRRLDGVEHNAMPA